MHSPDRPCRYCIAALDSVGGLRGAEYPIPGPIWRYVGKRERVRVARVWLGYPPLDDPAGEHVAVRCHPVHGGKAWYAALCDFASRFASDEED